MWAEKWTIMQEASGSVIIEVWWRTFAPMNYGIIRRQLGTWFKIIT